MVEHHQGPTTLPWWEAFYGETPLPVKDIKHPNVKLLAPHQWKINDALALGEDDMWVVVVAGDFNTAKAVRAKVRREKPNA